MVAIIAIFPFVFPTLIGLIIYIIHDAVSSPISNQQAKRRIKRYCVLMFIALFIGWGALLGTLVAWLAEHILTIWDYVRLYVYVGLYALIPAFLLYIVIHSYHLFLGKPYTLKQKRKNNESNPAISC